MEYVDSFNAIKAGKAYIIEIDNMTLDNRVITFHVDSGASDNPDHASIPEM